MTQVDWYMVRNFAAFWIFGLCNNYGYVVMLSAGEDILNEQQGKQKNNSGDLCEDKLTSRHCTIMSTGAILLADILPTFCINLFLPFFLHRFPFDVRHGFICLAQAASYFIVAFSVSVPMSLIGVVIGAFGSGLGGMNFMALSSHFSKLTVSAYSSGTGGAGVVGSFAYAGLTEPHMANLSPKAALLIMLVVPIVFAITYWTIMDRPSTIHKFSLIRPSTWIVPKPKNLSKKSSISSLTISGSLSNEKLSSSKSPPALKNLTFVEKLKLVRPLLKYMIPLGLVYVGEYLINQGLTQFLIFNCSNGFSLSRSSQYRWYQVLYQVGVFVSRSSISVIKLPRIVLYLLPVLQIANAILFFFNAIYMFIPHIWIVLILIFYEGLLGGASYVNTFSRIHEEADPEVREYCMAFAGFADASGIVLAGFTSIPHDFMKAHNIIPFSRNIPSEIFCDILQFFDRNELEKHQLINRRWRNIIDINHGILPMRFFISIEIGSLHFLGLAQINKDGNNILTIDENENNFIYLLRSLKTCLFKKCHAHLLDRKTFDELQRIRNFVGQRIKTIEFDAYGSHDAYTTVASKYVQIQKVCIRPNHKEIYHILSNPSILRFPQPPNEISIDCENTILYYVDLQKLLWFIVSGDLYGASRYSIDINALTGSVREFCEGFFDREVCKANSMKHVKRF
uniref:F-box domain-containing protein n=1 Tax=Acrobeloides nanus TaxID=290746 RepID=A0A914D4Z6_9BILA